MKKIYIYTLLLLLLMSSVFSLSDTREVHVKNLKPCYGDVLIKVFDNNATNYSIKNCELNNKTNLWECVCNKEFNIILNVVNESEDIFYMEAQYFISPELSGPTNDTRPTSTDVDNLKNTRKVIIDNIHTAKVVIPKSTNTEGFSFFMAGIGVCIVILIVSLFIYIVRRIILKWREEESDDDIYLSNPDDEDEDDEFLNNLYDELDK